MGGGGGGVIVENVPFAPLMEAVLFEPTCKVLIPEGTFPFEFVATLVLSVSVSDH